MKLAIVGTDRMDFSDRKYDAAYVLIKDIIREKNPTTVITTGSGVGKIVEKATKCKTFTADVKQWENVGSMEGYRMINLKIASECDEIINILATTKDGYCYHCASNHKNSPSCYIMKEAEKLDKKTSLIEL